MNDKGSLVLPSALKDIGYLLKIRAGTCVFREGDRYRGPFLVEQGRCKVSTVNELGKELIINIFRCGDWMAAPPTFLPAADARYHATSLALEDSEILSFKPDAFRGFLLANPDFMFRFAGLVVKTTFSFQARLRALSLLSVQERLEEFLREHGAHEGAVSLPLAKNQIAALLGTTPESVSRAIRSLMEEGRLKVNGETYSLGTAHTLH